MSETPHLVNIEKEINSIFEYLISHGFSEDDADLFLADELPKSNFERLFVWSVEALEGKELLVGFYKRFKNQLINSENTDKRLNGRILCLAFRDSN